MKIIGITGGSGSGKTTLLGAVGARGGLVLDCDAIYHQLLQSDRALLGALEVRFPGVVENGALNRRKLGNIVFADPSALRDLNRLTHGRVAQEVRRRIEQSDAPLAAIDAIGLFESGLDRLCDTTVCVTAPLQARIDRLVQRDGISPETALARLNAQCSDAELSARCRHTLQNQGWTREEFLRQCHALLDAILLEKETKS